MSLPDDFLAAMEIAVNALDPPKVDTKPWVCDRDDCDGAEHDAFDYRHARTAQRLPAGDWRIWLLLTGRGWGKSRTGAESFVDLVLASPETEDGAATEWAIVAETFGDVRSVCVEGPSGVKRVLDRRGITYRYNKSLWQITLATGQIIHMLGADDADVGRGLNLSGAWLDELAKWRYARASWTEGLAPALRIGDPRVIVTTTPKPLSLLKEWLSRTDGSVYVTRGSTYENSRNLSKAALAELKARYEGTRLGRQELGGEYLDDNPNALWQRAQIDADRRTARQLPDLIRIVIGVDPAATSGEESDLTGIVAVGRDAAGEYWVFDDRSQRATPSIWAQAAVDAYRDSNGDLIVGETNNGGEMIETLLRNVDKTVPYKAVTATRGKKVRAEPISALYEQHRVHHVGSFPDLEDQLVSWTPDSDDSPDRMDALVWAMTELSDIGGFDDFVSGLIADGGPDTPRPPGQVAVGVDQFMQQLTGGSITP